MSLDDWIAARSKYMEALMQLYGQNKTSHSVEEKERPLSGCVLLSTQPEGEDKQ